jgi:outer membrane protein TolC
VANGLHAQWVATRAAANSFSVDAAMEAVASASGNVDKARTAFLPRIVGTARATTISNPETQSGSTNGSIALAPPGTSGRVNAATLTAVPVDLVLKPLLNQYTLQAGISVPVTDYFLRINHLYSAAVSARESASADFDAARAKAYTDGVDAYYEWLRARGAIVISVEALNDARAHLHDVRSRNKAGLATRADVGEAETNVLASESRCVHARSAAAIAEVVLRIALRFDETVPLLPGESIDAPPPPLSADPAELTRSALGARPELRSLRATAASLGARAAAAAADALPSASIVGNSYYSDPVQHQVLQVDKWATAWDVSAQLSWSPTDIPGAQGARAALAAQARQADALRRKLEQDIALEVRRAYEAVHEHDLNREISERAVESAAEVLRVARNLYINNEATALDVLKAETDLTQARTNRLNTRVDALVARANLDHAIGRDVGGER